MAKRKITNKSKVKILEKEVLSLRQENEKLHDLNNQELGEQMIVELGRYSKIVDELHKKYNILCKLYLNAFKLRVKYGRMLLGVRVRELLE